MSREAVRASLATRIGVGGALGSALGSAPALALAGYTHALACERAHTHTDVDALAAECSDSLHENTPKYTYKRTHTHYFIRLY